MVRLHEALEQRLEEHLQLVPLLASSSARPQLFLSGGGLGVSRITVTFLGPFPKELKFPFSVSDFDSSRVAKKTSNNDVAARF